MKTYQITVKGKVQGVYYRASTKNKARELQIVGTVKNLENGDVVIMAQAEEKAIIQLLDWCRIGPPNAKVQNVLVVTLESSEQFSEFLIEK